MRKTKIVCTMGPATDSDDVVRSLMKAGMDVCRLNFSHGDHKEQQVRVDRIKRIREELNLPVALLLDTKGPEIRTGQFEGGSVILEENAPIWIKQADVLGTKEAFSITYKSLASDVQIGSRVLIDDGLIELEVIEINQGDVKCLVKNGGKVSDRKSINLPNIKVDLPAITEKDINDIKFAIKNDFDFVAVSFVRRASDIRHVRAELAKNNGEFIQLISKIENQEGVDNFEDILEISDGIMVARGDLGVEVPAQAVPHIQKRFIHSCYAKGKPCITATQMLDSMIRNPRPTRAEVSDVANAIYDGTSAIMLSGETAAGKYPIEAVTMMSEIAQATENSIDYWGAFKLASHEAAPSVTNAISHACCTTAMDLKAKAIVSVTLGGRTAKLISRFRPACPIIAPTVSERNMRQLNIVWGVKPVMMDELTDTDALFDIGIKKALETGLVENGDVVVLSGGTPVGISGMTNTLKVQTVGRLLCQGIGTDSGRSTGDVLIIDEVAKKNLAQINAENSVIVCYDTDNDMVNLIRHAKAIVAESANHECHAVTVGRLLHIPVVYACKDACKMLKNGMAITVDSERGLIK